MPTATQTAALITALRSGDLRGANQMLEAMIQEQRERGFTRGADELDRIRLNLQRIPQTTPSRPHFVIPGVTSRNPGMQGHPYDNDEHEPEEENLDAIPENLQ